MPEHPRKILTLVHSNPSKTNSGKSPEPSTKCPFKQANGALDCPHYSQITSMTNTLANRIQWLALNRPGMAHTFVQMVDRVMARDGAAAAAKEYALPFLSGAVCPLLMYFL